MKLNNDPAFYLAFATLIAILFGLFLLYQFGARE
jgi:hypothetical protein